ncbi:MAG: tRNA (guanosine(37)-N1)-methyltransferase TrmD [Deltaproteobacteria bacterium]
MKKPFFHFITLFPETIEIWMTTSILGRAFKAGLFDFKTYQLRNFSTDKHLNVDDVAYGGGGGMVLKIEPLVKAVESIQNVIGKQNTRVIYFTPAGTPLTHSIIKKYAEGLIAKELIFVCGHYEGVDQRFVDHWVDDEISLGDFVLTGGELPAVAMADSMIRQLEGVLGAVDGAKSESFSLSLDNKPILEYPHYTRPSEFLGLKVPEVLLSGNHPKIELWRTEQAKLKTLKNRPDLLESI